MEYKSQYFVFNDLVTTGTQTVKTKDINASNINNYFYGLHSILLDGIETEFVHNMMIHFIFADKVDIDLSIFDSLMNIMMWQLPVSVGIPIESIHLFFPENITKKEIKEYIDNIYIDKFRTIVPLIQLNNTIDDVFSKFRDLRPFQMYLCNSLSLEDTIELMNSNPEFKDTLHFNIDDIPLEDVKDAGMDVAKKNVDIIKNSNHCLRDSFRTGEAINVKQYREVAINIGTKPDGNGSIFPLPISHSFMNGGLTTPEDFFIDSSVARIAQMLSHMNVGLSGEFARKLEHNNQDTFFYPNPNYVCDTKNFEEIVIDSDTKLKMMDLRYYRDNPNGVDKLLEYKRDKNIIGRKIYLRSPMKCASAARGQGICYKCYGNLAYVNREVNPGEIASEGLSSIYTQILLSAKHLLESLVKKLQWNPEFYDNFDVIFNTITFKDNINFNGCTLIIDDEIKVEDDMDDQDYNYYINNFKIQYPDGHIVTFETSEQDDLYFMPDVYAFISNKKNKGVMIDDDNVISIDIPLLKEFDTLFAIEMKNNELSRTMDKIKKLIDNKSVIESHDANTLLEAFIDTNIAGGITLNSVHFEILLMNQIRHIEDDLESPDWTIPNERYRLLTLTRSLQYNKRMTVRLEASNIAKAFLDPNADKIKECSINDLYFMEQPQEYLTNDTIVSDEYEMINDVENNLREPIKVNGIGCGYQSAKKLKTIDGWKNGEH